MWVVMAINQWLAFEILMMVYVTSAAPVEADSGGISNFFQKLKSTEDNLSTSYRDVDDYETYRQKKAEQGFTSLCWTESIIITEDKRSNARNVSKAYSIILESTANLGENKGTTQNTSCYKIEGEDDIKRERIFNFTTVKETDVYSIKEHKTLFCGAGPVLSEHFIVWPKLNRKQIEISISPMTSTKWRTCEENMVEDPDRLGSALPSENSSVLDNSEEQIIDNESVIDELPLNSTESSYDSNNSSSSNFTEPSTVGMSKNVDESIVSKSSVDIKNSSSDSKEATISNNSKKTTRYDWPEISTVSPKKGTDNSIVGSKLSTEVSSVTEKVSKAQHSKLNGTQHPENTEVEKSVDYVESQVSPKIKTKTVTKKDTGKNQKIPREYTTENSMGISDIQGKKGARELSNSLLNQNSNCTSSNDSICNEIMTKSSLIAEFQNTSSATLANLFFPNNTLLHIFRDAGNNSYILNAKVVLELKISDSNSKIEDEKGAYLVMEEESKYQILKHRV